jgi:hypothetical protein
MGASYGDPQYVKSTWFHGVSLLKMDVKKKRYPKTDGSSADLNVAITLTLYRLSFLISFSG